MGFFPSRFRSLLPFSRRRVRLFFGWGLGLGGVGNWELSEIRRGRGRRGGEKKRKEKKASVEKKKGE